MSTKLEVNDKALVKGEKGAYNIVVVKDKDTDKENDAKASNVEEVSPTKEKDTKEIEPARIMEHMRNSNIKDIITSMTVHDQLRMLRNIIENEEFKRRQRLKSE
jgi:hypothetical protein